MKINSEKGLSVVSRVSGDSYTMNAIESVNMSLRKFTKNRCSFPNDEALIKLIHLVLMNISQRWKMPLRIRNLHSIGLPFNSMRGCSGVIN